jgi:anti-sigma regulatory factor (Ser/Thr protein kinase)
MGLRKSCIKLHYDIPAENFSMAGEASSSLKKKLAQLGISPSIIKRAAIAMYEAEINAVIHAGGGYSDIEIDNEKIRIKIIDSGPGIPDVEKAMTEGYSTAPDSVRQLGFGAGMGLPNIKRYADKLTIDTKVGEGTAVTIIVKIKDG